MDNKKLNQKQILYVYMGSYAMVNGKAKLTYNEDKSMVYRKYRNIENGETITVNKASIDLFEKQNNIVFVVVDDYTPLEYERTYEVVKNTYEKELSSSNKEEAIKLIKRLTPLK